MLIGRKQELTRLHEAILARDSLLVHGQSGAGKTALLTEALSDLPRQLRCMCLVCAGQESPRAMWRSLIRGLAEVEDPQVMARLQRECAGAVTVDRWVNKQTSLRLRGILRRAMQGKAYWVFLDTTAPLPGGTYSLLQEWVWSRRTPVILLGRGPSEQELGKAARLFWHSGMRIELSPMLPADQHDVLESSIHRFDLSKVADDEFRDFILKCAAGLPGRIVRLCELASQNAYQWGGHVKLHTLAVDFLMEPPDGPLCFLRANSNA
jgi:hypothetical protein